MEQQNKEISLIIKEKKLIYSGLAFGLVLFLTYLMFMYVPLFRTQTNLLIRNIPKQGISSSPEANAIMRSESGFSNPLLNIIEIFKSDKLALKIYDRLNKDFPEDMKKFDLKSNEKWSKIFNKKLLKTKVEPSTDVINVKFKWVNKKNTNNVLTAVIDEFKKENLGIRKSVETKQRVFLEKKLNEFERDLGIVRSRVMNYKLNNSAFNMQNESLQLNSMRIDFNRRAELLKSQINYNDKKLEDLSRQLGFEDAQTALKASAIGDDDYLNRLNRDLTVAEQKYAYLTAKFTENYPEVRAVKNEIEIIKNNIQYRHKETLQNAVIKRGVYDKPSQDLVTDMSRVQAEKYAHIAELNAIENSIKNILKKEAEIPTKLLSLEDLQNKEKVLADTYNSIKQKYLNAIIKENEIVDNIVPLGDGSAPKFVLFPLLLKFLLFMVFGLLMGYSAAYIKEEIEDKWNNLDELEERTGKKVIGTIPWVKSQELFESKQVFDTNDIMGMAYNNVARKLISCSYQKNTQSICFISTANSRNKSSVIPNIAANMAKLNRTVILIDTVTAIEEIDNKKSSSKDFLDVIDEINKNLRLLGKADKQTLSEILKQALIPVEVKTKDSEKVKYFKLQPKKSVVNIQEYVTTKGFEVLTNYLKEIFEFVLIDTPAKPLIFPEVSSITDVSDATIIISALETNRRELIQTINKLENSSNTVLGIIPREKDSELEKLYEEQELNNIKNIDETTEYASNYMEKEL